MAHSSESRPSALERRLASGARATTCDTRYWIFSPDSLRVLGHVDHLSGREIELLSSQGLLIDRVADPLPPYRPEMV